MASTYWTERRDALREIYASITTDTPFPIRVRLNDKSFEYESSAQILDQLERLEKLAARENSKSVRYLHLKNGGRS